MKNKGFTLVELLAVLSILGVVIILALPTVINAFKETKDIISGYDEKSLVEGTKMYLIDLDEGKKDYNGLSGYKLREQYYGNENYKITVDVETLVNGDYFNSGCDYSSEDASVKKGCKIRYEQKNECQLNLVIETKKTNDGYIVTTGYKAMIVDKNKCLK